MVCKIYRKDYEVVTSVPAAKLIEKEVQIPFRLLRDPERLVARPGLHKRCISSASEVKSESIVARDTGTGSGDEQEHR